MIVSDPFFIIDNMDSFYKTVDKLNDSVLQHCFDFNILKKTHEKKKIDNVLESIIISILSTKTPPKDVNDFIVDIKHDNVLDLSLFDVGGNISDFLNPKWYELCMSLWKKTPKGLGTPNAAVGEGELMFVFISPHISKPKKGDLLVKNKIIELKGEDVRIMGDITGKEFRNKTLLLCDKYQLEPNKSIKNLLPSVELEKKCHWDHWVVEMSKLDIHSRTNFINDYLKCVDSKCDWFDEDNVRNITFETLRNEVVKILFSSTTRKNEFDKLVILGNGTNIKVIPNSQGIFNQLIQDDKIIVGNDYFRINQNTNIGWYIS